MTTAHEDQFTPAPVEVDEDPMVRDVEAWLAANPPATTKPEPVLRWEGNELWLGDVAVGEVWRGLAPWGWVVSLGAKVTEGFVPTEAEARTAAEHAVRDWLKRAGCV